MDTKTRNSRIIIVIILIIGFIFFTQKDNFYPQSESISSVSNPVPENFVIPDLNNQQTSGQTAFGQYCQSCHGQYALGTNKGPTFMHAIYLPGHHGDGAFFQAATYGAQAHHWSFGDMPPVEGVSGDEVAAIIAYVRALQRANGME